MIKTALTLVAVNRIISKGKTEREANASLIVSV